VELVLAMLAVPMGNGELPMLTSFTDNMSNDLGNGHVCRSHAIHVIYRHVCIITKQGRQQQPGPQ
jgi:hypothetical protein